MISAAERAPGSTWPIDLSPRNEARPRVARIGAVASAARRAAAAIPSGVRARLQRLQRRRQHVEQGFLPDFALAARLHRGDRLLEAAARSARVEVAGHALPSAMNSVP